MAIILVFLAPLMGTVSLFIWSERGRSVAIDTALGLGLGTDVEGIVRFDNCDPYVERGGPGSRAGGTSRGIRCDMVIEAEGERVVRPIDLDDIEPLQQVRQPGRVFGALGAAMPAGVIFDRLGPFGTLIFMSVFFTGCLIYLLWSTRRRRPSPVNAGEPSDPPASPA